MKGDGVTLAFEAVGEDGGSQCAPRTSLIDAIERVRSALKGSEDGDRAMTGRAAVCTGGPHDVGAEGVEGVTCSRSPTVSTVSTLLGVGLVW